MPELKPGWQRVKFGEVVRLSKERSANPLGDGIERYVGLEHIEPGDLRIRSWGDVADGTTFTTRFRPGHVLFGKRRAYQRKLAVADFDGVCSGDIYVLESADQARLVPELLPFICQTDAFFEHAVGTSAGSLSPRTNWASLAEYEFALPPLAEQRDLLRTLLAATKTLNELRGLSLALKSLLDAGLLVSFSETSTRVPLQQLCRTSITYGIVQAGPDLDSGVPYVRVSEMTGREYLDPATMMKTSPEISSSYRRTILELADIVVALRGVPGLCHIVRENLVGSNLSRGVARIAPSREVHSRYLLWAIRSPQAQSAVLQYANGWKGEDLREITIAQLRTLPIPFVPPPQQHELAERMDTLLEAWLSCRQREADFSRRIFPLIRTRVLGA